MSVINVDTSVQGRLTPDEGKLLRMAENYDQFIVDWEQKHPSVLRDRIPKGTFTLFNGLSQKTNVFRGVLGPQQGLNDWIKIEASQKAVGAVPGKDACQYNPSTYDWAIESFDFSGLKTSWRSPTFCVNDLIYVDYAKEQLRLIITAGSQVTDQVKETFARENLVKTAVNAGRAFVLCDGGLDYVDDATVRFAFDPSVVDSDGNTYVTFPAALLPRISTLNWSGLDLIRAYLSDQCPDAAIGNEGGRPIFGLMLDTIDFEKMVYGDPELREDFRYARATTLISGFNMEFKTYRGYALMHDARQPRFKFTTINASSEAVGTRVVPRRKIRPGTVGLIPETNPEYIRAEIGMGLIFMSDMIQILVPPTVNNLGSGLVFGPAPDFNGAWSWLNIKDSKDNPLGEIGYFFARFAYFVKPLRYASEVTAFLYRRCPHAIRTKCAIESLDDVGAGAVAMSGTPVAADFDATLRTVTLLLAKKLAAGVGDTVTVKNDASANITMQILEDRSAPTYKFGWASGATNAPSAVTELDDPAIVTVTVA